MFDSTDHGLAAPGDVRLCHADEVDEGQARGFVIEPSERRKAILVRRGGRLFGWLDSCPHYPGGTPMAWRSDAYLNGDNTHLACHSHGALFDIETGACVLGPCLGQSLTAVEIRQDDDGVVWARL